MRTENVMGIGEPAGIDSLYSLEYYYGGKRYRFPFCLKGRKEYEDALYERYLSLLDHIFFGQDAFPVYRELFLQEMEELVEELKGLGASIQHLKGFLETKGSPDDARFNRILSTIERPRWRWFRKSESSKYSPAPFLFKVVGITVLVVLANYLNIRFFML